MRRIKTYKKWSIWRLTAAEAIDVGGRFAAFLPETDPGAMDEPEWAADIVAKHFVHVNLVIASKPENFCNQFHDKNPVVLQRHSRLCHLPRKLCNCFLQRLLLAHLDFL